MFEFIQNIGTSSILIILIIFVVFLVLMRRVLKTVINMVWIAITSAIFPLVLNFLGFSIPLSIDTILFFVTVGLGLYFIYIVGKIIYTMLGFVEKSAKAVTYPFRDKDKDLRKRVEKIMEEKKKEQN